MINSWRLTMDTGSIKTKFGYIWPMLNEKQKRAYAATEALALGHGGITLISEICGLSRVLLGP
jgi:hypothetical protein